MSRSSSVYKIPRQIKVGTKPCFVPFQQQKAAMFCLDGKHSPELPIQELALTAEFCWSQKKPWRLMVLQALVYLTKTMYRPLFSDFLRCLLLQSCINCSSPQPNQTSGPANHCFSKHRSFFFPARSEWLHQFPKHELYSFCWVGSLHSRTCEESPCPWRLSMVVPLPGPGGAFRPASPAEAPRTPAVLLCGIYRIFTGQKQDFVLFCCQLLLGEQAGELCQRCQMDI